MGSAQTPQMQNCARSRRIIPSFASDGPDAPALSPDRPSDRECWFGRWAHHAAPWVLDLKVRLVLPKNGPDGGSPQPAQAAKGPEKLPIPRVAIVAQGSVRGPVEH